jgi:hypothetical protein
VSGRAIAWTMAAIMAIAVGYSVARIPIQMTDSLIPILQAQQTSSIASAFVRSFQPAYFRPMRWAQIQAVYELSNGHYVLAFKAFHVALAIACFVLFVMVLDPRTSVDLVALAFALTVLTGLHTFRGMVWEAYPVDHYLEVGVFCLLALVLARSRGGWWADLGAVLTFLMAALTLESGVLVWVVVVAAWMAGFRGVSKRALVGLTVLLAAYVLARFPYLATGAPTLVERSTGFGFSRLDPDELVRRFGAWPYGFYAYNVASSLISVLLSEPRGGTWTALADLSAGRMLPGTAVNLVSSSVTTAVIGWFLVTRARAWRAAGLDESGRICVVAMAVLVANAAVSYSWTKDEIMSPGGVFYAVAAFFAMRELVMRIGQQARPRWKNAVYGMALAAAATGWGIRTIGFHYQMQTMGFNIRNEWVYVDDWLAGQHAAPATAEGARIVDTLRSDALSRTVVNPYLQSQAPRLLRLFP